MIFSCSGDFFLVPFVLIGIKQTMINNPQLKAEKVREKL